MSSPSITCWINELKAGKRTATQSLWEHYFRQLVARARQKLAGLPRRAADAEKGRFPQLHDRHDLSQVLVVITDRKAFELLKSERRQKRGGAKVLDEAALRPAAAAGAPLAEILGREPSPEFAAQVAEEFRRLLDALDDVTLRRVALRKMEGYTIKEIAAQQGVAPRTVQRWLQLGPGGITDVWESLGDNGVGGAALSPAVPLKDQESPAYLLTALGPTAVSARPIASLVSREAGCRTLHRFGWRPAPGRVRRETGPVGHRASDSRHVPCHPRKR
jgi:hypothetical protein